MRISDWSSDVFSSDLYDIAEIGLRTQRLENLTLGNPEQPELSAYWVEVDISALAFTPRVTAVRAGGVRLRGRIVDGKLLRGEIDKFRDPESTAPFNLPDIKISLQDARMRLDTPMGPVGLKIDGSGHLQARLAGKMAAVTTRTALGGCRDKGGRVSAHTAVWARHPHMAGT